ncbi:MAG: NAD-dependent epimerase/dehydratase family protein [Actinomycetota bacterium]
MDVQNPEAESQLAGRRIVVTGAAGFIGSHVVDSLLAADAAVTGVDDLDPWYEPEDKLANLTAAAEHGAFTFRRCDVADPTLIPSWRDADVVFHLAGRPGVQDSWGHGFDAYADRNVRATQSVLEAALHAGVERVVLASSSSVYGASSADDDRTPRPVSPYGVTKLAAEQLAAVYAGRGLEVVNLRYFTVFGPRQRPDMAIHRLIEATRPGARPFVRRGSGEQRREFTYVADVVAATIAAAVAPDAAERAFDVGGGVSTSLNELIELVGALTGRSVRLESAPSADGDPMTTIANIEATEQVLGWQPTWSLTDGVAAQVDWHAQRPAATDEIALAG